MGRDETQAAEHDAVVHGWWVESPAPINALPLQFGERPDPHPGPGQVRVAVRTCGVCRTDLHLAEGDVPPRAARIILGHEIVGVVDQLGAGTQRFALGDRIGVASLRALPVVS